MEMYVIVFGTGWGTQIYPKAFHTVVEANAIATQLSDKFAYPRVRPVDITLRSKEPMFIDAL